ncbi:MAG TPA: ATP-binding cassette domain-containing protein, partial [Chthonomonadales bacterium]|nr:ATP-binding cassette domain-containing protein [Chthonomonadales bacterium]
AIFRTRSLITNDEELTARSLSMLQRMNLLEAADSLAGDLPYGLQRRLEIARALATDPELLLLDEPAAGMNPQEKQDLMALIRSIRSDFNLTVLLIEHDMKVVMGVCERIYVLDYGQIICEGKPEKIRNDPAVIAAYLGETTEQPAQAGAPAC